MTTKDVKASQSKVRRYTCTFDTPHGPLAVIEPVSPVNLMVFCSLLLPLVADVRANGVQQWAKSKVESDEGGWVKRIGRPRNLTLVDLMAALAHEDGVAKAEPVAENEVTLAHRGLTEDSPVKLAPEVLCANKSIIVDSDGAAVTKRWAGTFAFDSDDDAFCSIAFTCKGRRAQDPGESVAHAIQWAGVEPVTKSGVRAFMWAVLVNHGKNSCVALEPGVYGVTFTEELMTTMRGDHPLADLLAAMIERSTRKSKGIKLAYGLYAKLSECESNETGTSLTVEVTRRNHHVSDTQ